MREIQLPLSQTQKIRLQKALEKLESLSTKVNHDASVTVADSIHVNHEDGVLKGHGTADLNGEVVATLCGVVERVNKLVYVRALRSRYKPEVGDIVIGRVVEVVQKRWRLEINYNQDAILMLSSMNMPDGVQGHLLVLAKVNSGGISKKSEIPPCKHSISAYDSAIAEGVEKCYVIGLWAAALYRLFDNIVASFEMKRRRTAVDELSMRSIFEEKDVVCAEVRGFQYDGLHLQARSRKYGKLNRGQLLTVLPYLVKRQKQHFHHLEEFGIDLILGCNGFIWVGEHVEAKDDMVEDQVNQSDPQILSPSKNSASLEEQEKNYTTLETRQYICRAANAVRVLSTLGFNITLEIIKGIVDLSLSMNLDVHEMLGSEFCVLVAEKEAERRSSNKKKR